MTRTRITDLLRRRLAVWLALLVVGSGPLAPTVSHALVSMRLGSAPQFEICTAEGPRRLSGAADMSAALPFDSPAPFVTDSPDGQESAHALVHCPFCLLSTDHGLAPPHLTPYLFYVKGEPARPMIWQAFFFHTVFSLSAAPRGPPAISSSALVA